MIRTCETFQLEAATALAVLMGVGDSKKEFLGLWLFFSSEYRLSCLNCSLNFLIVIIQNSRCFFSLTGLDALSNFSEKDWSSVSSTFSWLEHMARGEGSESEVLRLVSKFWIVSMNFHLVSLVNNRGIISSRNLLFR